MIESLINKIENKELDKNILMKIASMSMPFTTSQFLQIFPSLYSHSDEEVKSEIYNSFFNVGEDILFRFLESAGENFLEFYFDLIIRNMSGDLESYVFKILSNPECPESIYIRAADMEMTGIIDYLVNNQSILVKSSHTLQRLTQNSSLSNANRIRLNEYIRFGILGGDSESQIVGFVDTEEVDKDFGEQSLEPETDDVDEVVIDFLNEFGQEVEEDADEKCDFIIEDSELETEEELTLYQRLLKMKVSKRIERALKGTKEERTLLIRDSNKTVALAVVNSPKITDNEVATIASLRNVHRDVLRAMSKKRENMKNYKVVVNLVKNPKTPQDIVMQLMTRLIDRDIKLIIKDRSLPEFLRRNAMRISKSRKKS